ILTMDKVKSVIQLQMEEFDKQLSTVPALNTLQSKTKIPKVYAVGAVGSVFLLLVIFQIGANFLVNLFGYGYAAFASIGALQTPGKEDDSQWLTYWVIYGLLNLFEYFTSFVLYWIPFYFLLKTIFLAWLMLPSTRGAERLYNGYILPAYNAYSQRGKAKPE
ncbi:hypothetical protein BB560_004181, partial [Smittium megazygosporum]